MEARGGFAGATPGQIAAADPKMKQGVPREKHLVVFEIETATSSGVKRRRDDLKNPLAELDFVLVIEKIRLNMFDYEAIFAKKRTRDVEVGIRKAILIFRHHENGGLMGEGLQSRDVIAMSVGDEIAKAVAMVLFDIIVERAIFVIAGVNYDARPPFVAKDVGVALLAAMIEFVDFHQGKKIRPKPYFASLWSVSFLQRGQYFIFSILFGWECLLRVVM